MNLLFDANRTTNHQYFNHYSLLLMKNLPIIRIAIGIIIALLCLQWYLSSSKQEEKPCDKVCQATEMVYQYTMSGQQQNKIKQQAIATAAKAINKEKEYNEAISWLVLFIETVKENERINAQVRSWTVLPIVK